MKIRSAERHSLANSTFYNFVAKAKTKKLLQKQITEGYKNGIKRQK
jgi:hypothetical protein